MISFRHSQNENEGLSYYQASFNTLSGVVDVGDIFSKPEFNAVSAALYASVIEELSWTQRGQITFYPSYIPDWLRAYMEIASSTRESYTPERRDYWLSQMSQRGFIPEINKEIFDEFYKLFQRGLVPRMIWLPDQKSVQAPSGNGGAGGTRAPSGLPWGIILPIGGAAILGVGALFILKKD